MQRIEYLDNAKYIAIILMVIGHCYWKESVPYMNKVIYSFHMPLFFLISGYFIKPLSIKEGLSKYAKSYLKPYLITALASLAIIISIDRFCLANGGIKTLSIDWIVRWTFASGSANGKELLSATPIVGPIWFLFALFWACLIYSRLKMSFSGFGLMVLVFTTFILAQTSIHVVRLPFSLQAGFSSVLFLWGGDLARNYKIIEKLGGNIVVIFCVLFIWLVCILKGSVSVSHCVYGLGLISVVGAITASLIVLKVISLVPITRRCGGGYFGTKTLYVLCFHEIFQYSHYVYGNPFENLTLNPVLALTIELLVELVIALGLTSIFCEIKNKLYNG